MTRVNLDIPETEDWIKTPRERQRSAARRRYYEDADLLGDDLGPISEPAMFDLEDPRFRDMVAEVHKHYGPGPHESGSDQDVHGSGGAPATRDEIQAEYVATIEPLQRLASEARVQYREAGKTDHDLFREINRLDQQMMEALELRNNQLDQLEPEPEPDLEPDEYRGGHQPSSTYGAPGHDLTVLVSGDIYLRPDWYFSMNEDYNQEGASVIQEIAGAPDAEVEIFRAVPAGVDDINPGDWITTSRDYAELHGDSNLSYEDREGNWVANYDILSRVVTAKELMWPGDSIVEFGWFPDNPFATGDAETLEDLEKSVWFAKHMGPGPHESGSDQDVHGSGWRGGRSAATVAPKDPLSDVLGGPRPSFTDLDDKYEEAYGEHYTGVHNALHDFYSEDWVSWQGSKDIREAALWLLGGDAGSIPADPHIEKPIPPGPYNPAGADRPELAARMFLDWIKEGGNSDAYTLYRAIDAGDLSAVEEAFWDTLTPGAQFDAPLLAFLDTYPLVGQSEHSDGPQLNLLDKFGTDVLLAVEGSPAGFQASQQFSAPYWTPQDEGRWLNGLSIQAPDYLNWMYDDDSLPFPEEELAGARWGYVDEQLATVDDIVSDVRGRIDSYVEKPNSLNRGMALDAMMFAGMATGETGISSEDRWAGLKIPEGTDEWYDAMDYGGDGVPYEVVSGGRYEVVDVSPDPRGVYGKIVTVTQVALFDPSDPEHMVAKADVPMMTSDAWLGLKALLSVEKHLGPGPHPSGSPQSVHRGGTRQGVQPELFGGQEPNPARNVTYRLPTPDDFGFRRRGKVKGEPQISTRILNEPGLEWTPELQQKLDLAFEEFDAAYPGVLPDDMEVILYHDAADGTAAFTWGAKVIGRGAPTNAIYVNSYYFNNPYQLVEPQIDWNGGRPAFIASELLQDFAQDIRPTMTGVYEPEISGLYQAAKTPEFQEGMLDRILFHELGHIAEARVRGFLLAKQLADLKAGRPDVDWDDVFPSYKNTWYPKMVEDTHPSLPSPYSTDDAHEYFAEALTDAYFNGEDAAPLSQWTALQVTDLVAGREPTRRPSEMTLSALHRGEIDA